MAATLLYNGDITDTAAIITALGTETPESVWLIPTANGLGLLILKKHT